MTIKTKTNLWLWMLTGRSKDFAAAALNTGLVYPTAKPSAAVVEARKVLRLDVTSTDMYVLGALASVYASVPCLRNLPAEEQVIFRQNLAAIPPTVVTGATLLPADGVSWPSVTNHNHTSGTATWFKLKREGSQVRLTSDAGLDALVPYEYSNLRLDVPAVIDLGIKAAFKVSSWDDGAEITVAVAPSRYPFAQMVAVIQDNSAMLNLMSAAGTMEAFASSHNQVRQVGALASAVLLSVFKATTADLSSGLDAYDPARDLTGFADTDVVLDAFVDFQLMIHWDPIFLYGDPVTYNP